MKLQQWQEDLIVRKEVCVDEGQPVKADVEGSDQMSLFPVGSLEGDFADL